MARLPPVQIHHPHVVIDESIADGSPMVEGTRVPVRRLFSWHRQGTSVETLLRRYPQLGPARILDALAFAFDNLELITADLFRERDALAQENTLSPPRSLKDRIVDARNAQETLPFKSEPDKR